MNSIKANKTDENEEKGSYMYILTRNKRTMNTIKMKACFTDSIPKGNEDSMLRKSGTEISF
jgi:hypothetical protein